jgi:hypothetical protein
MTTETTTTPPTPAQLANAIDPAVVAAMMARLMQIEQSNLELRAQVEAAETARKAAETKAASAVADATAKAINPEEWQGMAHPNFPGLTCEINLKHAETWDELADGTRKLKVYCEFRTTQEVWYLRGPAQAQEDSRFKNAGPCTFSPEIVIIPSDTRCQWSAPTRVLPHGGLMTASMGASSSIRPRGTRYEQTRYARLLEMLAHMPEDDRRVYMLEDEAVSREEWHQEAAEQGKVFFAGLNDHKTKATKKRK